MMKLYLFFLRIIFERRIIFVSNSIHSVYNRYNDKYFFFYIYKNKFIRYILFDRNFILKS